MKITYQTSSGYLISPELKVPYIAFWDEEFLLNLKTIKYFMAKYVRVGFSEITIRKNKNYVVSLKRG